MRTSCVPLAVCRVEGPGSTETGVPRSQESGRRTDEARCCASATRTDDDRCGGAGTHDAAAAVAAVAADDAGRSGRCNATFDYNTQRRRTLSRHGGRRTTLIALRRRDRRPLVLPLFAPRRAQPTRSSLRSPAPSNPRSNRYM